VLPGGVLICSWGQGIFFLGCWQFAEKTLEKGSACSSFYSCVHSSQVSCLKKCLAVSFKFLVKLASLNKSDVHTHVYVH